MKFPKGETLDEESPAGFAVWFRNKTRNTESGLWYIDEDDKALALTEDEDAAGIPSTMPTDVGDLDDDQKNAMAWSIAIPGEDANPKLEQNLRSGPFPIMWTRGHEGDEGTWDLILPGVETEGMFCFKQQGRFYENTREQMKVEYSTSPPKTMMMMMPKSNKQQIQNRLFPKTGRSY